MGKDIFLQQYQSKEWYELSKKIKARDNNTCQVCGCNNKPLNVHHLRYGENGNIFVDEDLLITVCEDCHVLLHEKLSELNSMVEELKYCLTPIELVNIFQDISDRYCCQTDSLKTEKIPQSKPFRNKTDDYIENISIWRKNIRKDDVTKRILLGYYEMKNSNKDTTKYENKFKEEFGYSIEEHISNNKEVCVKMDEESKKYLEKISRGEPPF